MEALKKTNTTKQKPTWASEGPLKGKPWPHYCKKREVNICQLTSATSLAFGFFRRARGMLWWLYLLFGFTGHWKHSLRSHLLGDATTSRQGGCWNISTSSHFRLMEVTAGYVMNYQVPCSGQCYGLGLDVVAIIMAHLVDACWVREKTK